MTSLLTGTYETRPQAASRAADLLCLAAAPVFAILALLTAGGGDMLCTMPGMSALGGMSLMYLLMSLFHLTPWLKRNSRQARKGE
ncbi:MAG TPA: hypothetical protein VGI89_02190 [Rhizomicrobium sp.]